jgi:ubiquinone biosynthesis protein COQ4
MFGKQREAVMLDRTFAEEFLLTIDDPGKHGVHLLFNSYWRYMPERVRETYVSLVRNDEGLRNWVDRKHFPQPYNFDSLAALAPDTFGAAYHRHIIENNLNKEIASGYRHYHEHLEASGILANMPDDVKYMILRGFQTHDLLHIATGFDTTGLGEIALQAFCLAQLPSLYFATWMSVVTTRMAFLEPASARPLMDAITEGWRLGRTTPNLQIVDWEDHLGRPLSDVRRAFAIPAHAMMRAAA